MRDHYAWGGFLRALWAAGDRGAHLWPALRAAMQQPLAQALSRGSLAAAAHQLWRSSSSSGSSSGGGRSRPSRAATFDAAREAAADRARSRVIAALVQAMLESTGSDTPQGSTDIASDLRLQNRIAWVQRALSELQDWGVRVQHDDALAAAVWGLAGFRDAESARVSKQLTAIMAQALCIGMTPGAGSGPKCMPRGFPFELSMGVC